MKKYSKEIKGNKLAEFITRSGIDKKKIAKLLGLKSEEAIARWENGETLPDLNTVFKLSLILKTDLKTLYPDLYSKVAKEMEGNKKVKNWSVKNN
jgi:transcriptional regulator with XRE-family HTH domain